MTTTVEEFNIIDINEDEEQTFNSCSNCGFPLRYLEEGIVCDGCLEKERESWF